MEHFSVTFYSYDSIHAKWLILFSKQIKLQIVKMLKNQQSMNLSLKFGWHLQYFSHMKHVWRKTKNHLVSRSIIHNNVFLACTFIINWKIINNYLGYWNRLFSLLYFLFSAIGNENLLLNVKIGLNFLRETETMKQVQFSFQGSEVPTPGYKRCENQCKHKYVTLILILANFI